MSHEDLTRDHVVEGSSDRAFGFVLAAVLLVVCGWPLFHGASPRWWAAGISLAFVVVAMARPALLAPLNRRWMKFGILLGQIVSPVALGIVFFGAITPIGAMLRLFGKDPLRLVLDRKAQSYWILRKPPGPPRDSMTNQF